ncbi:MAG TPA: hypothetical protein VFR37_19560 [Longimicrobium sp.]|nr:hypothetical protein [Longimicrobium sp.]
MNVRKSARTAGALAWFALGAGAAAGCDPRSPTGGDMLVPTVVLTVVGDNVRVGDTVSIFASLRLDDSTRISSTVRPSIGWTTVPEGRLIPVADDSLGRARFLARSPGLVTITAYTIPNAVLDSASTSVDLDLRVAWMAVATGAEHTCAVGSSRFFCWGGIAMSAAGGSGPPAASLVPRTVPGFEGGSGLSITAGGAHACGYGRAFGQATRVSCWGVNDRGQLGNGGFAYAGSAVAVETAELPVGRLLGPEAGERHACALAASAAAAKAVYCWGDHAALQLGGADVPGCPAGGPPCHPTPVSAGVSLRTLDAGGEHTCGISDTDHAVCWGSDAHGQLGRGDGAGAAGPPAPVPSPWLFAQVTAGATHSCAITPAGGAYCWGDNRYGQLGSDATAGTCTDGPCVRSPVAVSGGVAFRSLSAGDGFTCGISVTDTVYCWGRADRGQLGRNASDAVACGGIACSPRPVRVLDDAFAVDAGGAHACAVIFSRDLLCWGSNSRGQLGDGRTNSRSTPRVVEEPEWTS